MELRLKRLPNKNYAITINLTARLEDLHIGTNPIFIRVTQEDGQTAGADGITCQGKDEPKHVE